MYYYQIEAQQTDQSYLIYIIQQNKDNRKQINSVKNIK